MMDWGQHPPRGKQSAVGHKLRGKFLELLSAVEFFMIVTLCYVSHRSEILDEHFQKGAGAGTPLNLKEPQNINSKTVDLMTERKPADCRAPCQQLP